MIENFRFTKKPSFIHIGPQRCGTTSLYNALLSINCVPKSVKEIQFFDKHYDLGMAWYLWHFQNLGEAGVVGEVCPSYFDCAVAIDRIYKDLPNVKVMCTLRDPVSRVSSYYRLLRMYNQCPNDIYRAWQVNKELRTCCFYSKKVKNWKRAFGEERFLVLFFDDLKTDSKKYLVSVFDFIGLASTAYGYIEISGSKREAIPRFPFLNAISAKVGMAFRRRRMYSSLEILRRIFRPVILHLGHSKVNLEMTKELKRQIGKYYEKEICAIEQITQRDLSSWRVI